MLSSELMKEAIVFLKASRFLSALVFLEVFVLYFVYHAKLYFYLLSPIIKVIKLN